MLPESASRRSSPPSLLHRQALRSAVLLVGIVGVLLLLAYHGFETLSAARAYVGGEGHWSKAQKDAVYHLLRYARTADSAEYAGFEEALEVPLGDRQAREELERDDPDLTLVYQGLLQGRNHPEDLDRMATFFRRFRGVGFVDRAIGFWATGDSLIAELVTAGEALRAEVTGSRRPEQIQAILTRVHGLSRELGRVENAFSQTIGEGARWAAGVAFGLIVAAAAVLLLLAYLSERRALIQLHAAEQSRQALELQLHQAQKMEVVGQFTGGIAHDFNNLLSVILANARLVQDQLPPGAVVARAELDDLVRAARRGADMVRKLLAFSRSDQLQFRPLPLHELVEGSAAVIRRMLPAHIALRVTTDPATPHVRTDPAAMEQILLNLATNARDAMPEGGVLSIRTARLEREDEEDGPSALLEVQDTGSGMDPATRERLFEPFFTTKPPGKGTGLGGSVIYGLVRQHGGTVRVESNPGRGTTVQIRLPAVTPPPADDESPAGAAPRGNAAILVVEDEEPLRRAAQRILERQGYRVHLAADGEEALEVYARHRDQLALVLTDVVMPRLGGPALCRELRRQGATVPFLFTSGYTGREMPGAVPVPDGAPFLPKPWDRDTLLGMVDATLRHPDLAVPPPP